MLIKTLKKSSIAAAPEISQNPIEKAIKQVQIHLSISINNDKTVNQGKFSFKPIS